MKDVESTKAWFWLSRMYRLVQAENQIVFREYGLGTTQFEVLDFLRTEGPSTQNALTRHLRVTKGNISIILKGLERRGLIERNTPKDDRRLKLVGLTKKGRGLLREALRAYEKSMTFSLSSITASEKKDLVRILEKLYGHFAEKQR